MRYFLTVTLSAFAIVTLSSAKCPDITKLTKALKPYERDIVSLMRSTPDLDKYPILKKIYSSSDDIANIFHSLAQLPNLDEMCASASPAFVATTNEWQVLALKAMKDAEIKAWDHLAHVCEVKGANAAKVATITCQCLGDAAKTMTVSEMMKDGPDDCAQENCKCDNTGVTFTFDNSMNQIYYCFKNISV